MTLARPTLLALLILPLLACRVEDRTPAGTRRDETAVRAVAAAYYEATAAQDWRAARAVLWDSADVALQAGPSAWITFEAADPYLADLSRRWAGIPAGMLSPRLIRTEYRQADGVAGLWVVLRRAERGADGAVREVGRAEHFVMRRLPEGWRIVQLVSVADARTGDS
jgi:hypothetical protein